MAASMNQRKERFSLLLLEPGEIYFEDFSVFHYPPTELSEEQAIKNKIKGRLKICSRSIVFDPQDLGFPIYKFMLRDCVKIEEWNGILLSRLGTNNNVLMIKCKQIIEMRQGNEISPYVYKRKLEEYLFSLNYVTCSNVVPQMCQLLRASTLTLADQESMIAAIVQSRQNRVSFDTSWLENLYEKIVMETVGDRITPLVTNPGRVLLTSTRLYFQPFNNAEPVPVIKIKLAEIKRIVKRRYLLQQVGLEIISSTSNPYSEMYMAFSCQAKRDQLYNQLMQQPDICLENTLKEDMTLKWQNGLISNYDYLIYLNSIADRSFNDVTQYPVFPWVIADYTSLQLDLTCSETFRDLSKPIGALNQRRLERLKDRYGDMPAPKFLYGSHYSTPGYIIYYLVRKAPQYMLCLQNGKFDQPDRMFNSIAETWNNVLTGATDFKELIPEFYDPTKAEFLVNRLQLNFGSRQDGTKVNHVELPPWSQDPEDFCNKCRQALESDYISRHIHQWIDLVFGYKQRGIEAQKADNVFYYLTYEGAIDLNSIKDPNELASLKAQIMDFGQTPAQLFTSPHPAQLPSSALTPITDAILPLKNHLNFPDSKSPQSQLTRLIDSGNSCTASKAGSTLRPTAAELECESGGPASPDGFKSGWCNMGDLQPYLNHKLHKEAVTGVASENGGKYIFSVSQDSMLKMYSLEDQQQLRSISISSIALSGLVVLPDSKNILVSSWDNNVYVYSIEYGRHLECIPAHDDAVSKICWSNGILSTASWDSTVKVWSCPNLSSGWRNGTSEQLYELDHDTGVSSLDKNSSNSQLLSGTQDGQIYLWDLETQCIISQSQAHSNLVHDVKFSPDGQRMLTCGDDNYLRVIDVNTCTEVYAKNIGDELKCLCWNGKTVLAGTESGDLLVWDLVNVQLVNKIKGHKDAVCCIYASEDGTTVITGGTDKKVILWRPF